MENENKEVVQEKTENLEVTQEVIENKETVSEVKTEEKAVQKKVPKLFTKTDEKITVDIDIVFNEETGEILSILASELGLDTEAISKVTGYKKLEFVFTKPSYDKMNKYRQRCMEFDLKTKVNVLNQLKLRDFFIIHHLKEWNVVDENGEVIKLTFDANGYLSDESLEHVYELQSSIVDTVLTSFERKLLLIGL